MEIFNINPDYIQLALALLGVFSIIAKLSPTEADNKIVNFILKLVNLLGLTKKV